MSGLATAPSLGATQEGRGFSFALFSRDAEMVELCLFDETGRREEHRHELKERTGDIWHDHLPSVRPGQVYGYRVYGPYRPEAGLRFNPHKLLVDPYARELRGRFTWDDAVFGYDRRDPAGDLSFSTADSAPFVPKAVAVPSAAPSSALLRHRREETVILEIHAKGYTERHPDIPAPIRGRMAALASPEVIEHLTGLGVTAVELLPVQAFIPELPLVRRGLTNYWGYNTLAFFALHGDYLASGQMEEFTRTVDALHEAGIEVILDVVFNHTAESDELGPTLSFRGIDNRSYYRLDSENPRLYIDWTGCGNTLNASNTMVAGMIVDCLRHWAERYGVDGFRFDLAAVLVRDRDGGIGQECPLLNMIGADPALSRLKLIAEPWDATEAGYLLGGFPAGWLEWNDRYRGTARRFWGGAGGLIGELATRVSGSSDVMRPSGRGPSANVNYVTAHDGFTLEDLVSYEVKANWGNGEGNRDGTDADHSFNCGVEGPSGDPAVQCLRLRQKRNLLATLMLSRGVPMLRGGDELSQSQRGNNNAYCQDNEIGWLDWGARGACMLDLRDYAGRLIRFRRAHPVLWRDRFLADGDGTGDGRDVVWLRPDGAECEEGDWQSPEGRVLAFMLVDASSAGGDTAGERLLVVMNGGQDLDFALPASEHGWRRVLDTADESGFPRGGSEPEETSTVVAGPAVVVFADEAAVLAP